jgi:hypothetical protein
MTLNQAKSEKLYLQKLEDHFDANNMYFSYGYDLTQSLQRQVSTSPDPNWKQVMGLIGFDVQLSQPAVLMDLNDKADSRYFWNHYLCEKMMNGNDQEGANHSVSSTSSVPALMFF